MNYSSLMVHLDLGVSNETLLDFTANMAERFGAGVIGIAAQQPLPAMAGDVYMAGDLIERDRVLMDQQGAQAEHRFRTAMHNRVPNLQWRSTIGYQPLADWAAAQARAADLLLMAPIPSASSFDSTRRVGMADLLMLLGRPLIVVPPASHRLDLEHAVIGWKDTREARRAVLDALPLLCRAARTTVVEIVENTGEVEAAQARLTDVVTWLQGHDVTADFIAEACAENATARLHAIAAEKQAGLMVVGAYGHSRLREWVLGGMTRQILRHPATCSFLSH